MRRPRFPPGQTEKGKGFAVPPTSSVPPGAVPVTRLWHNCFLNQQVSAAHGETGVEPPHPPRHEGRARKASVDERKRRTGEKGYPGVLAPQNTLVGGLRIRP